jgi:conjugal transfer pilus assembly protein TraK
MQRSDLLFLVMVLVITPAFAFAEGKTASPAKPSYPAPPQGFGPRAPGRASLAIDGDGAMGPGPLAGAASPKQADPPDVEPSAYESQTVPPEAPTPVTVSSSDVNRISCSDQIIDALSSAEKGAIIKIVGKDAFLKFNILKAPDGKIRYTATPTEIFIVCGDSTYNLVAYPKKVPSKTIRLGSGTRNRIKANQGIFASLPFEAKIMRAIKDVYKGEMPDSYQVTRVNKPVGNFREFSIIHRLAVQIEGEGLTVHEFELELKPGLNEFRLNDKLFVNKIYGSNIVAICPEKLVLYPGEITRLFIAEQRGENIPDGVAPIDSLKKDDPPYRLERAKGLQAATVSTQASVKGEGQGHEE